MLQQKPGRVEGGTEKEMPGQAARVLVIDDDAVLCEIVQDMLTQSGYAVETATSGTAGLERIAAGGVDVILLDIMMPGLDGLEVCRRVRQDDSHGYVPIILLTALRTEADQRAGFAAGADDFISKPYRQEDLLARVQVWTEARYRLESGRAQLRELATRVLQEQEQLHMLTQRLLAVLQGMTELSPASAEVASWHEELAAVAAALEARVVTLPLRA
jgi:DNA-binding response OmpR family regulator